MQLPENIRDLAHELRTQDNRATHAPQYQVRRNENNTIVSGGVFLTNKAAQKFKEERSYDHPEGLHVYVASGWRNEEWEDIRNFLLSLT